MKSWRDDPEGKFAELEKYQTLQKPTHCSKCSHQGNIQQQLDIYQEMKKLTCILSF